MEKIGIVKKNFFVCYFWKLLGLIRLSFEKYPGRIFDSFLMERGRKILDNRDNYEREGQKGRRVFEVYSSPSWTRGRWTEFYSRVQPRRVDHEWQTDFLGFSCSCSLQPFEFHARLIELSNIRVNKLQKGYEMTLVSVLLWQSTSCYIKKQIQIESSMIFEYLWIKLRISKKITLFNGNCYLFLRSDLILFYHKFPFLGLFCDKPNILYFFAFWWELYVVYLKTWVSLIPFQNEKHLYNCKSKVCNQNQFSSFQGSNMLAIQTYIKFPSHQYEKLHSIYLFMRDISNNINIGRYRNYLNIFQIYIYNFLFKWVKKYTFLLKISTYIIVIFLPKHQNNDFFDIFRKYSLELHLQILPMGFDTQPTNFGSATHTQMGVAGLIHKRRILFSLIFWGQIATNLMIIISIPTLFRVRNSMHCNILWVADPKWVGRVLRKQQDQFKSLTINNGELVQRTSRKMNQDERFEMESRNLKTSFNLNLCNVKGKWKNEKRKKIKKKMIFTSKGDFFFLKYAFHLQCFRLIISLVDRNKDTNSDIIPEGAYRESIIDLGWDTMRHPPMEVPHLFSWRILFFPPLNFMHVHQVIILAHSVLFKYSVCLLGSSGFVQTAKICKLPC
ncbi:hypothetical protein VP01_2967g2 [Puccinia sorghi]|uniref:Uncharacterized protein n=1 Tax=Puccinia sorghi TaxID=27349 RepID=A0A0L6V0T5_9BASI|nr:hypothetical protein VP01_2967g2 [Puccinia sorghi]